MATALTIHLLSTAFMTGVIWFVQVVHYPSFHFSDPARFLAAMQQHQRLTSFVVVPAMLAELLSGAVLLFGHAPYPRPWILYSELAALVATWLCTGLLSVPLHERLLKGQDAAAIDRLVFTNWPRVFLWTLRSCLLFL